MAFLLLHNYTDFILILGVIGLLFLLGQWSRAQKDNKKKEQKELDKMISKDLK